MHLHKSPAHTYIFFYLVSHGHSTTPSPIQLLLCFHSSAEIGGLGQGGCLTGALIVGTFVPSPVHHNHSCRGSVAYQCVLNGDIMYNEYEYVPRFRGARHNSGTNSDVIKRQQDGDREAVAYSSMFWCAEPKNAYNMVTFQPHLYREFTGGFHSMGERRLAVCGVLDAKWSRLIFFSPCAFCWLLWFSL